MSCGGQEVGPWPPPVSGTPVQPGVSSSLSIAHVDEDPVELLGDDRSSVSEADLALAEEDETTRRAADNLNRHLADERLRQALAEARFKGPVYELFAQELAAYGLAVCGAWLLTGEMFRQCASRGYRIGPQPDDWTEHDRTSLADETVVQALKDFRDKGLERGGWRVDGGASMKTYFVTACVYAFLNAYRRWHRERAGFRTCSPVDPADLELFDAPTDEDVAQYALVKVEVDEACSDKTDYQRAVLVLRGLGFTHAEIAEVLGKSASAIERLLGRVRNTAMRNKAAERRTQRD